MAVKTYGRAIRDAMSEEMDRDPRVLLWGEDVGALGGAFGITRGMLERFGPERIIDTPISENVIVGAGVGAATMGLRPIVELQYADFLFTAGDEVFLKAAMWRYMHGGAFDVPLVIRCPTGATGFGPEHSVCPEAYIMHTPGLLCAVPSTPADAKGLLKEAIRIDNPVMFLEHKLLYATRDEVPDGDHTVPFGRAAVRREGDAVTVVAWQDMLRRALAAADELSADGIEIEVIDPRTLVPFDSATIVTSVQKTGACLVVEEGYRTLGVGAEIGARLLEEAFAYLDRPLRRLAIPDVPIPSAMGLVDHLVPSVEGICAAVRDLRG